MPTPRSTSPSPTDAPRPDAAPPPRRRRRTSDEVRARLLDAARAEFERAGFAGATTATIAAGAAATEAQLFRYFRSKAELFRAAVLDPLDRAFEAFNAAHLAEAPPVGADWADESRRYIADLSAFVRAHERLLLSLIVAQAYGGGAVEGVGKVEGLKAYFALGAASMRAHGSAPPRVDPALMVRVSFGAVLATVLFRDWMFGGTGAGDDAVAAALAEFVRDGVAANHAAPGAVALDGEPRPG